MSYVQVKMSIYILYYVNARVPPPANSARVYTHYEIIYRKQTHVIWAEFWATAAI